MRLQIRHSTLYNYANPVAYGLQELRLWPQKTDGLTIHDWTVTLTGLVEQAEFTDQHGNHARLSSVEPDATTIEMVVAADVEVEDRAGVVGPHVGPAPLWLYLRSTPLTLADEGIAALLEDFGQEQPQEPARLHDLSHLIADRVAYETGATGATTTAEGALKLGQGVCQDHAHIFVAASRQLGIPARYVSGYLMMDDRIEQEATHAWAEAYLPSLGWVGFDVSNGISPDGRYVRLATGLDYREAAPVLGMRLSDGAGAGAGNETLAVAISVQQ
ncbi:transglutaminase family protein [Rhizobiaceae bacterium]|nr:transglutaminase family protein [Rhizobiaceae bacterium]